MSSSILACTAPSCYLEKYQSEVLFHSQDMGNRRLGPHIRAKTNTRKIIGRLTYSPVKHKQKFARGLRDKLLAKAPVDKPRDPPNKSLLTFGSLNVNGLDTEAHWAVSELVKSRDIDVRSLCDMY